jgi:translation initiation factor IF-2
VNIIHASTGSISANDVMLAAASKGIIIGFNVRPTAKVRKLADAEKVEIRLYDVIYDVISDVKEAMAGRLTPTYVEKVQGQAQVIPIVSYFQGGHHCRLYDDRRQAYTKRPGQGDPRRPGHSGQHRGISETA